MEEQVQTLAGRRRLPCVRERLWKAPAGGNVALLPFRCPRCGDNMRFRSLNSLRAHLQLTHTFPTPPVSRAPPLSTLPRPQEDSHAPPELQPAPIISPAPAPFTTAVKAPPPASPLDHTSGGMSMEAELQVRLWVALKKAELQLQSGHAQYSTAHQRPLVVEEQHSRQVHSAAMVIASLRQQLATSQHQLEQRESEVLGMQSWLALAAQHELRCKETLRSFIETLLQRLHVAESSNNRRH
ncbi:protein ZNF365 [Sardina pilchardus]|uniref:protein ZNF365 n=1 Tax=Sardina pilchardus TaxID=27697 RepID=UPI002E1550F0